MGQIKRFCQNSAVATLVCCSSPSFCVFDTFLLFLKSIFLLCHLHIKIYLHQYSAPPPLYTQFNTWSNTLTHLLMQLGSAWFDAIHLPAHANTAEMEQKWERIEARLEIVILTLLIVQRCYIHSTRWDNRNMQPSECSHVEFRIWIHMSSRNINMIKHTQPIKCLFWGKAVITPEPLKWKKLEVVYNPSHSLSHSISHLATSDESSNLI